jgi:hypothetical protein
MSKVAREETRKPIYTFQCMRCFIVSGIMSNDPNDAPLCCGGERMTAIRIRDYGKEAEDE